jgi:hypothetical protein
VGKNSRSEPHANAKEEDVAVAEEARLILVLA